LTRKCLEVLVDFGYKGKVSVLTKSPLVVRDIDLLKKLDAEVGITVTTYEDRVVRFLEGRTPSASARIKALRKLHDEEILMLTGGGIIHHTRIEKDKRGYLYGRIEPKR